MTSLPAPPVRVVLPTTSPVTLNRWLKTPAPDVEILTFTLAGPVLAVRPYCAQPDYWQVYFDTNKLIRESFGAAGFATPKNRLAIRNVQG